MTKEEIVQALRLRGAMLDQIGYALQLGEGGFDTLMVYAADMIEAQAAEIEKLKALKAGRNGYTIELNEDYFRDAVGYLKEYEESQQQDNFSLFDLIGSD